jgi:hypothetical protein
MKVFWLNDSLVFRAEDNKERQALSVVFHGLGHSEPAELTGGEEETITVPSIA